MKRIQLLTVSLTTLFVASGCVVVVEDDTIPPYDACAYPGTVDDCSSETDGCAGIYIDGASGNICTSTCYDSLDCPYDARGYRGECVALDGVNFLCLETCVRHSDCLAGFSCRPPAPGFDPLCLPSR